MEMLLLVPDPVWHLQAGQSAALLLPLPAPQAEAGLQSTPHPVMHSMAGFVSHTADERKARRELVLMVALLGMSIPLVCRTGVTGCASLKPWEARARPQALCEALAGGGQFGHRNGRGVEHIALSHAGAPVPDPLGAVGGVELRAPWRPG
jgi:hypothetical protein